MSAAHERAASSSLADQPRNQARTDTASHASGSITDPTAGGDHEAPEEILARLFRDLREEGQARARCLETGRTGTPPVNGIRLQHPEAIPDELQKMSNIIIGNARKFPQLVSDFNKGIADGLNLDQAIGVPAAILEAWEAAK